MPILNRTLNSTNGLYRKFLNAPSDVYPGEEAATALAKSRAKRWLDQIDMLFDLEEMEEGGTE